MKMSLPSTDWRVDLCWNHLSLIWYQSGVCYPKLNSDEVTYHMTPIIATTNVVEAALGRSIRVENPMLLASVEMILGGRVAEQYNNADICD